MDRKEIVTRHEAQTLKIGIKANALEPVMLSVYDRDKVNTFLTRRDKIIRGYETFHVRMPLCPQNTVIEVDGDAVIDKIIQQPLQRKMAWVDMKNPDIKSFVSFSQRFAYNAGVCSLGKYVSDDKKFTIVLDDVLRDETGRVSLSPMRIGEISGIIEVSQQWILKATVPMRMAILLHEFAHKYMNAEIDNEIEADLNALLIYLGLGYPRIEAYEAFLQTFLTVPLNAQTEKLYESNKLRYDTIHKFITDFENKQMLVY